MGQPGPVFFDDVKIVEGKLTPVTPPDEGWFTLPAPRALVNAGEEMLLNSDFADGLTGWVRDHAEIANNTVTLTPTSMSLRDLYKTFLLHFPLIQRTALKQSFVEEVQVQLFQLLGETDSPHLFRSKKEPLDGLFCHSRHRLATRRFVSCSNSTRQAGILTVESVSFSHRATSGSTRQTRSPRQQPRFSLTISAARLIRKDG